MAWIILIIAGFLESGWAVGLKYSHGFTRPVPSLLTAAGIVASMGLLAWSVRSLPLGTAYATWVGIGTAGTVVLGIVLFDEPVTVARTVFLVLLAVSIVGLKFSSGH